MANETTTEASSVPPSLYVRSAIAMPDSSAATTRRERFRLVGREGEQYVWQSVQRLRNDSRYVEIRCGVEWFWNRRPNSPSRSGLTGHA